MSKNRHAYFRFDDEIYMNFIMHFLRCLEPICFKADEIIYNEL